MLAESRGRGRRWLAYWLQSLLENCWVLAGWEETHSSHISSLQVELLWEKEKADREHLKDLDKWDQIISLKSTLRYETKTSIQKHQKKILFQYSHFLCKRSSSELNTNWSLYCLLLCTAFGFICVLVVFVHFLPLTVRTVWILPWSSQWIAYFCSENTYLVEW